MPTYEYACKSCHRHFEVVQSFSDSPLETCEECGGPLKRVFHPVGIVLKGSGFYATDNRSGKTRTPDPKKDDKKSDPPSTTPTTSSSAPESKPAAPSTGTGTGAA